MGGEVLQRRWVYGQHAAGFIGAPREMIVDIDNWDLALHDGQTPGGYTLAKRSDLLELDQKIFAPSKVLLTNSHFQIAQLGRTHSSNNTGMVKPADRWFCNSSGTGAKATFSTTGQMTPHTIGAKMKGNPRSVLKAEFKTAGAETTAMGVVYINFVDAARLNGERITVGFQINTQSAIQLFAEIGTVIANIETKNGIQPVSVLVNGTQATGGLLSLSAGVNEVWLEFDVPTLPGTAGDIPTDRVFFALWATQGGDLASRLPGLPSQNVTFELGTPVAAIGSLTGYDVLFEAPDEDTVFAKCQKYLQTSYDRNVVPGSLTSHGMVYALVSVPNVSQIGGNIEFPVSMAAIPAVTIWNPSVANSNTWRDLGYAGNITPALAASKDSIRWYVSTPQQGSHNMGGHWVADTGI